MEIRRLIPAVVAAAALVWGAPALGDVVGPPPSSCPNGAEPESCHGGAYCPPWRCAGDHECTGGRTCEERDLCVSRIDCGGRGGPWLVDDVEGPCTGGTTCDTGACQTMYVCVTADDETLSGREGCGCRMAVPRDRGFGSVAVLIVAVLALASKRRSRRT